MKFTVSFLALVVAAILGVSFALPAADIEGRRIVNGTSTTIEQIPFQVSILFFNSQWCGASILDENTILTAAHCFDYYFGGWYTDLTPWSARVGSSMWREGGQLVTFADIRKHEGYNPNTYNNDIAILKLATPIVFGPGVQPVTVAGSNVQLQGNEMVQISGWGHLEHGGAVSEVLQKINLPTLTREHCTELFSGINPIQPSMFCAGDLNGLGDSCNGDSGGPVVDENNVQVGIVSWGLECAQINYTGVYTYVPYMSQWIAENRNFK